MYWYIMKLRRNLWTIARLAIELALVGGYILNVQQVWLSDYSMLTLTGESVVRIVGVFLPILGGIIGFI